jgi:hypothetical protein
MLLSDIGRHKCPREMTEWKRKAFIVIHFTEMQDNVVVGPEANNSQWTDISAAPGRRTVGFHNG